MDENIFPDSLSETEEIVSGKRINFSSTMKNKENSDSRHRMINISSRSSKSLKEWKAILTGRGIRHHGKAIVSGAKVVSELIKLQPEIIHGWITSPSGNPPPSEMSCDVPWYRLNRGLFRELDVHGTGYPLLIVKIPEFVPFQEMDISDNVILLVPFQDPSNVGAVIRSAVAFGVTAFVLLKEAANPFHPKSIRAAGTPAFTAKFMTGPSINELVVINRPIIALSPDGIDIGMFVFPDMFALLPGLEGPGVPEELKPDFKISIPMEPCVESLNAAVATSIVLYEWRRLKR